MRFFPQTAWLLAFAFLFAKANADSCAITRTSGSCAGISACQSMAKQEFSAYVQSQMKCGVKPTSVPFILEHSPSVPPKGTIVLIHGLTASPSHMGDIARRLQKEGYNVVVPILTGHGGSNEMAENMDLEVWKKDVKFAGEMAQKLGGPLFIAGIQHSTPTATQRLASTGPVRQNTFFLTKDRLIILLQKYLPSHGTLVPSLGTKL